MKNALSVITAAIIIIVYSNKDCIQTKTTSIIKNIFILSNKALHWFVLLFTKHRISLKKNFLIKHLVYYALYFKDMCLV